MTQTLTSKQEVYVYIIFFAFICLVYGSIVWAMVYEYHRDQAECAFLTEQEQLCREKGGYLEKDTIGRNNILIKVFCRDKTWTSLIYRKEYR